MATPEMTTESPPPEFDASFDAVRPPSYSPADASTLRAPEKDNATSTEEERSTLHYCAAAGPSRAVVRRPTEWRFASHVGPQDHLRCRQLFVFEIERPRSSKNAAAVHAAYPYNLYLLVPVGRSSDRTISSTTSSTTPSITSSTMSSTTPSATSATHSVTPLPTSKKFGASLRGLINNITTLSITSPRQKPQVAIPNYVTRDLHNHPRTPLPVNHTYAGPRLLSLDVPRTSPLPDLCSEALITRLAYVQPSTTSPHSGPHRVQKPNDHVYGPGTYLPHILVSAQTALAASEGQAKLWPRAEEFLAAICDGYVAALKAVRVELVAAHGVVLEETFAGCLEAFTRAWWDLHAAETLGPGRVDEWWMKCFGERFARTSVVGSGGDETRARESSQRSLVYTEVL